MDPLKGYYGIRVIREATDRGVIVRIASASCPADPWRCTLPRALGVLLVPALLAALVGCASSETGATSAAPPDELPVLLLDGSVPDPEALARTFLGDDMTPGEPTTPDDTAIRFRGGGGWVWIKDGELTFGADEPREPVSVAADEAVEIATEFVESTIGVPDDAVLRETHGAMMSTELGSGEPGTPFLYTIQWERIINGIPVAGAQWIRVDVGEAGDIFSLHRRWHTVTGEGEMVHVRPATEVIEPGEWGAGTVFQTSSVLVSAELVAAARLVYYVPFAQGGDSRMIPAWEVIAEEQSASLYFHAGTGELLGGN